MRKCQVYSEFKYMVPVGMLWMHFLSRFLGQHLFHVAGKLIVTQQWRVSRLFFSSWRDKAVGEVAEGSDGTGWCSKQKGLESDEDSGITTKDWSCPPIDREGELGSRRWEASSWGWKSCHITSKKQYYCNLNMLKLLQVQIPKCPKEDRDGAQTLSNVQ